MKGELSANKGKSSSINDQASFVMGELVIVKGNPSTVKGKTLVIMYLNSASEGKSSVVKGEFSILKGNLLASAGLHEIIISATHFLRHSHCTFSDFDSAFPPMLRMDFIFSCYLFMPWSMWGHFNTILPFCGTGVGMDLITTIPDAGILSSSKLNKDIEKQRIISDKCPGPG